MYIFNLVKPNVIDIYMQKWLLIYLFIIKSVSNSVLIWITSSFGILTHNVLCSTNFSLFRIVLLMKFKIHMFLLLWDTWDRPNTVSSKVQVLKEMHLNKTQLNLKLWGQFESSMCTIENIVLTESTLTNVFYSKEN